MVRNDQGGTAGQALTKAVASRQVARSRRIPWYSVALRRWRRYAGSEEADAVLAQAAEASRHMAALLPVK